MSVLTIAIGDIKRLCSIPSSDTSQDTPLTALLSAEQLVHEYALDPGILALAVAAGAGDGGLATLTLGVTELLAGSFLTNLGRFPHWSEPLPLVSLIPQAAAELTIATADIKRLLTIPNTDQDAAIGTVITAEQLAFEYALDPSVLAAAVSTGTPNAGLKALLTQGIAEQIAAAYLNGLLSLPDPSEPLPIGDLTAQAAAELTIAAADIKQLLSITDSSQDTAITACITAEQLALEYALDPASLAAAVSTGTPNAGLKAWLTLGVCEQIAAAYLGGLLSLPDPSEPLPLTGLTPQAATVLTVATSDVKRLLEITDTSQDTAIAACITAEQLALEYALDPAVLEAAVSVGTPNAGLKAWLTLGLSEQIAGTYLAQSGRVPGLGVDVQISSLHFTTSHSPQPDKLGVELALQGTTRLEPFLRLTRARSALRPITNVTELEKRTAALAAQGTTRLEPFLRLVRARHAQRPISNITELEKRAVALAAEGTARLHPFLRSVRAEHALKPVFNQPDLYKLGVALVAQGLARLAPYTRAKRSANIAAAGTTPDGYAPIPQLIAGGILPGAIVGAPPSVFGETFRDIGPDHEARNDSAFGWELPEP